MIEFCIDKREFWFEMLNGMSITRYLVMVIYALLGALVFFLSDVPGSIKNDKNTPDTFSFRYMIRSGAPRLITGLIIILVLIPNFPDIISIALKLPQRIEITGGIAFIIGINADLIAKKFVLVTRSRVQKLYTKIKNGG